MSEQNVNVVRRSYDAFARGDFAAVVEAMDPTIEWVDQDSLPWGGAHRGYDEFADHMQSFASHFDEFRIDPQEFLGCGDSVVVVGSFAGRGKGGVFDSRTVWIWQLRDGKVTRVETFSDGAAVLQALGR